MITVCSGVGLSRSACRCQRSNVPQHMALSRHTAAAPTGICMPRSVGYAAGRGAPCRTCPRWRSAAGEWTQSRCGRAWPGRACAPSRSAPQSCPGLRGTRVRHGRGDGSRHRTKMLTCSMVVESSRRVVAEPRRLPRQSGNSARGSTVSLHMPAVKATPALSLLSEEAAGRTRGRLVQEEDGRRGDQRARDV